MAPPEVVSTKPFPAVRAFEERPLLYSGPMVVATLRERDPKWQTRRVAKLPPAPNHLGEWEPTTMGGGGIYDDHGRKIPFQGAIWHTRTGKVLTCPYGQPGDRLWVREAWARTRMLGAEQDSVVFRASDNRTDYGGPWKPGIHMFRRDSRIDLEITGTRAERLHAITEADARAEGCAPAWLDADDGITVHAHAQPTYRRGFARLWREINGDVSWSANPLVWVVEFRRIRP